MKHTTSISIQTKFALAVTILLWSSAFVGIRASLVGYSPGALALFRFLVASACLCLICLNLPQRNKITFNDKLLLLLIGAITGGGYHVALNYGEITVSSGIASFIISQSPVFTTVLAILFLKERLNLLGVAGTSISVLGVSLILLSHPNEINFAIGSIYVLIAAILGSVYTITQKHFLHKYNAIEVTAYFVWGATLILCFYYDALIHEISHAPFSATLSVIYLGIFPAAVAYLSWSYVLAKMPASRAANYLYWMPIITSLLGWILLGEIPTFLGLVGGLVALLGVWILNHSYKKMVSPVMIEELYITKK